MPSHETMPMESVWDYPRPPALRHDPRRIVVECAGEILADTTRAWKIMETSHPPVFYVPPTDVRTDLLRSASHHTWCEWKGSADYLAHPGGIPPSRPRRMELPRPAAALRRPQKPRRLLRAGRVDRCSVDGYTVQPQQGDFYGGWITPEVRGPFKGGAHTHHW